MLTHCTKNATWCRSTWSSLVQVMAWCLLNWSPGVDFSEIGIEMIKKKLLGKLLLKSSAMWRPFRSGLRVLSYTCYSYEICQGFVLCLVSRSLYNTSYQMYVIPIRILFRIVSLAPDKWSITMPVHENHDLSNHRHISCLFNRLFRRQQNKLSDSPHKGSVTLTKFPSHNVI